MSDNPYGIIIFYEPISNSFIHASKYDILTAVFRLNRNFTLRGESSVNEFLAFIGTVPFSRKADEWGWDCVELAEGGFNPWIDIEYVESVRAGVPCLDIIFWPEPVHNVNLRGIRDEIDSYRREWDPHGLIFNGTHPYKRINKMCS